MCQILTNKSQPTATRKERDPTGQAGNRSRAKTDISRRIRALRPVVLAELESFPVQEVTINKVGYKYQVDPLRIEGLYDWLLSIMYDALELNGRGQWFFNQYVGKAYEQGTAQAIERLKILTETPYPSISEAMSVDSVLSSPEYTQRFEIISARAFEDMKGFAGAAAADLGYILGDGVARGQSPRTIARDIRKKFDQIEGYRALRIARTEVNNAYTKARSDVNQDARDRLGLDVRVMHISALVESTRVSHAARHGKIYLPSEQSDWWSQGSNLVNCLCSTSEVIFIDGEPTNKNLIKKVRARGEQYFKVAGISH